MEKQVLLVDTESNDLTLFHKALKGISASFKCTDSTSAMQALSLLNDFHPDYIFVNLNLPVINGIDVLKRIRKDKAFDAVPVFVYSTAISKKLKRAAIRAGAAGCVVKPGNTGMLIIALTSLFIRLGITGTGQYKETRAVYSN